MKHILKYDQHNEVLNEELIGALYRGIKGLTDTAIDKVTTLFSEHKFKNRFIKEKFASILSNYDIKAIQKKNSSFDFYHEGRLIAFIRQSRVADVYYLVILVYLDEIIAPRSEYIRYPTRDLEQEALDIINRQKVRPIALTRKTESRSQSKLIEMLIKWWRTWSNSGKQVDEED